MRPRQICESLEHQDGLRFKLGHHARSVNAMALGGTKTLQLATGGDDKLLKVFNL